MRRKVGVTKQESLTDASHKLDLDPIVLDPLAVLDPHDSLGHGGECVSRREFDREREREARART